VEKQTENNNARLERIRNLNFDFCVDKHTRSSLETSMHLNYRSFSFKL